MTEMNNNGVTANENAKMKHFTDKDFCIEMMRGAHRHWCPDNGYGAIDDTMPEAVSKCRCFVTNF